MTRAWPIVFSLTLLVASPGAAQTLDTASPAAAALEDAKTALKGGSYGTALEAAERLLAVEPSSLAGHYIAGAALIRLGRLDEAESHLGIVEAASPKWAGLQFQFGYLAFTRAEQIPSGADVERQRSLYLEAARRFAAELERTPGQLACLSSRAVALAKAGSADDAVAAHEAWIAAVPQDNAPVVSLGGVLARAGRADEALALLDRLPDKSPDAVRSAAMTWGPALYERDDTAAALPLLRRALEADPTNARAQAMIVGVRAKEKDLDATAVELARFLAMNPSQDEAEQVGELIRSRFAGPPDTSAPRILKLGTPRYPKGALGANIRTDVTVLAQVGIDGKAGDMILVPNRIWSELRSMGFEDAAFEAVRRGRFEPGLGPGGTPAPRYLIAVIPFEP